MRISAREAKARADIVTCKEACLDGVMNRIKEASYAGNYETRIYNDMPNEVSLRRLFDKDNLEYVISQLTKLGFRAKPFSNSCCLKIEWKDVTDLQELPQPTRGNQESLHRERPGCP